MFVNYSREELRLNEERMVFEHFRDRLLERYNMQINITEYRALNVKDILIISTKGNSGRGLMVIKNKVVFVCRIFGNKRFKLRTALPLYNLTEYLKNNFDNL